MFTRLADRRHRVVTRLSLIDGTPRRNSLVHDSQPDDLQARRPNAVCISPGVNGSAIIDNPRSLKFVGKNKSKNKKHCVNFYLKSVPKMKGL
jgi:hypothetical protein